MPQGPSFETKDVGKDMLNDTQPQARKLLQSKQLSQQLELRVTHQA